MIKIIITAIGKDKDPWVAEASAHYAKLLSKYAEITLNTLPSIKKTAKLSPAEIMRGESLLLEKHLNKTYTIALADFGKKMDSHAFAKWLEKLMTRSQGTVNFIIGGAYGIHQDILDRADETISLSPLTFSHQLVRPVLLEQLFRSFSILNNTDYHK